MSSPNSQARGKFLLALWMPDPMCKPGFAERLAAMQKGRADVSRLADFDLREDADAHGAIMRVPLEPRGRDHAGGGLQRDFDLVERGAEKVDVAAREVHEVEARAVRLAVVRRGSVAEQG